MREIIIIAAMAENRVIGKNNVIPWSLKEDMARFRKLTNGCPCIMGRKTWESLPKKPLPGRLNIVVSKTMTAGGVVNNGAVTNGAGGEDVKFLTSLPLAIEYCSGYEKIFICGGQAIYRQALEFADKIELTLIHKQYEGDTFFPEIDAAYWRLSNTEDFDIFSFITYTRIKKKEECL
jgi:dihydrofolate reductase